MQDNSVRRPVGQGASVITGVGPPGVSYLQGLDEDVLAKTLGRDWEDGVVLVRQDPPPVPEPEHDGSLLLVALVLRTQQLLVLMLAASARI